MDERSAWNAWNRASNREHQQGQVQREQAEVVERWLAQIAGARTLRTLEIGCGTGWMCERLARFGSVVGVDIADEVVDEARERLAALPQVSFLVADYMRMPITEVDVVVALESIAHFEDPAALLSRIAASLAPGGWLMIATQNRPVMERNARHLPNRGWHRHWMDHHELRALVGREFDVAEVRSITPKFFDGPLHVLNSERVEEMAGRVGLRRPLRRIKRWEEDRYLGFTLMCLAQKPAAAS